MHASKHTGLRLAALVATLLATGLTSQAVVADEADEGFRLVRGQLGVVHAPSYPRPNETYAIDWDATSADDSFGIAPGRLGSVYAPTHPHAVRPYSTLSPDVDASESGFRFVGRELGWTYEPRHERTRRSAMAEQ